MDAPVERYVPALAGTAWEGTSVQDIANMASGMDCRDSDGYQNTDTCVYRMEESLGITAPTGEPIEFLEHVKGMRRLRPPAMRNEYVSANTNVLMLIMEAVTGKAYADILREEIWHRIGPEADALVTVSREGHAYASGGVSARLRDVARFGLLFTGPRHADVVGPMLRDLESGGIGLTEEHRADLAEIHAGDLPTRAGWQWDRIWDDGALYKGGYLGQGIYVDPARELVVAWFGTGEDYSAVGTEMDSVARQLSSAGVFSVSGEEAP